MAANRDVREARVNEAISKWIEMDTCDLIKELKALEEKEESLSADISMIRALKKALKEVLNDRDDDDYFDPDHSAEDRLRSVTSLS